MIKKQDIKSVIKAMRKQRREEMAKHKKANL